MTNAQRLHGYRFSLFQAAVPALLIALASSPDSMRAAEASQAIKDVSLKVSPLVLKSEGAGRYQLRLGINTAGITNGVVRLSAKSWKEPLTQPIPKLGKGSHTLAVLAPAWEGSESVTVEVEAAGAKQQFGPFSLSAPRQWTVYLSQHTHTDIGYTRPQTEILPEHLRYIDYALDFCDLTDSLPPDAQFRWTCETAWAVREYVKARPARQVQRLRERIAQGRIEVCGLLLNMSEIAPESALAALVRPLRELRETAGVEAITAMQNDVNGAGWCLPDYFADIGLRYLTMGINQTRSILPFDKPTAFWWESPSGKRVLAYRSDHYNTANFWGIEKGDLAKFRPGVENYLLSLQDRKNPFDRIGVQFSGYFTDNSPPSTIACELVKRWNEQYAWPKLRLSTAREFLSYVEKEHGSSLAVHRQAWPDWWTDGFGSAARETAAARETETSMQVTHGLFALARLLGGELRPGALARAAAIQDNLLFYHEHTYGAAESISDPLAENAQVQWGEKAAYVWSAVKDSNLLREEAFGLVQDFVPRAEVPVLAVVNTLNWTRSGLVRVFIDHEILPADREPRILDGNAAVLAQPMERRAEGTYWALWIREVPPMGYKLLRLEHGTQPAAKPAHTNTVRLENTFYSLEMDPQRGAVRSLVDRETGRELVDGSAQWALGQCVYETMPVNREMKTNAFTRTTVRNVKLKPGAAGPIWKSLLVSADLDGSATNRGLHAEIRLYETEKRVELHYNLRKLPVATPESVYVVLPFNAPDSRMLYEAQGGAVEPGRDQLPGSSSDWQTIQSFLSVRQKDGQIITGTEQAPLVQLGGFNLGKWQPVTAVDRPHVYSWVMNNYWFTNFRTQQEGEFKWNYYLTSTRDTSREFATRFGWGSRVPFATRVFLPAPGRAQKAAPPASALRIDVPNILVVESRPALEGSGVVLHLREIEGRPAEITREQLSTYRTLESADLVNVLEQPLQSGIRSLRLEPYEAKFVRLNFR